MRRCSIQIDVYIHQQVQTLSIVGVYYTLLGQDTFGTVEWRNADTR